MSYLKAVLKNNLLFFVILFSLFLTYYLAIHIIYVRPFVNMCNAAEKGNSSISYIKDMNQVIRKNKHINITYIDDQSITLKFLVPYVATHDLYECDIWIDKNNNIIIDSELSNY